MANLKFNYIVNGSIFKDDFDNMTNSKYNTINFKKYPNAKGSLAVVYAPNGTGKTSLCKLFEAEQATSALKYEVEYKERKYTIPNDLFYIIKDNVSRNSIEDSDQYLLGSDIRREYELTKKLEDVFSSLFGNINVQLKNEFSLSKISSELLKYIEAEDSVFVSSFLKPLVNNRDKGKTIDRGDYIKYIESNVPFPEEVFEEQKLKFIINDFSLKTPLYNHIVSIRTECLSHIEKYDQIEQDKDALELLEKYPNLDHCIVCDNKDFDCANILERKNKHRNQIIDSLSDEDKHVINDIINAEILRESDPFDIRGVLSKLLKDSDLDTYNLLCDEIEKYRTIVNHQIHNIILKSLDGKAVIREYKELIELQSKQPEISDFDLNFISSIANDCIGRELKIDRAADKHYVINLEDTNILGVNRNDLPLSTGEMNFLSLAFELILAKNSNCSFVVIDDPISSFDSIYKNKIAYCLIKFLENKNTLIFTHNVDLLKLLQNQVNGCYNLYMLSNFENGKNGFIPVSMEETKLLTDMRELIKLFQNKDGKLESLILDKKLFLISMIPFMRGLVHLLKKGDYLYTKLSNIMHGYNSNRYCVHLSSIYKRLFGYDFGVDVCIKVSDVLNIDCTSLNFMDSSIYPLLSESLKQTLIYYHLRMIVEKRLCEVFKISINPRQPLTLNQIIVKCFKVTTEDSADMELMKNRDRAFFTSRKTLINEFNHFESCLDIFQPAIDINEKALNNEIVAIQEKLEELPCVYAH